MNYEKTLRQLRAACFDYEGRKDEQCQRLITRCKQVLGYDRPSTEYVGTGRPAICPNVATD